MNLNDTPYEYLLSRVQELEAENAALQRQVYEKSSKRRRNHLACEHEISSC